MYVVAVKINVPVPKVNNLLITKKERIWNTNIQVTKKVVVTANVTEIEDAADAMRIIMVANSISILKNAKNNFGPLKGPFFINSCLQFF